MMIFVADSQVRRGTTAMVDRARILPFETPCAELRPSDEHGISAIGRGFEI